MIWKINFILVLSSLHSFGFGLPQIHKRDVSSPPKVTYEKDMNKKVLGVLKTVYSELKNTTDSGQRSNFPRTYGMSLNGQQGFVWNMLNDARKMFEIGAPSGKTVQANTTERNLPEENEAEPQESEENIYLQIFSELLENDEFWNWLTGWIETYTELLDEHIKVEVEATVTKQIKEYFDRIDYLINDESGGSHTADIQLDEDVNSGQGPRGFVNTNNVRNSTVYNEYVTNIYFADQTAEKVLVAKLAKAKLAKAKLANNDEENGQTDTGEISSNKDEIK